MVSFHQERPLLLLAVILAARFQSGSSRSCIRVDEKDPCTVELPVNYQQGVPIKVNECEGACLSLGYYYAAMSQGIFCSCFHKADLEKCDSVDDSNCDVIKCADGTNYCGQNIGSYHKISLVGGYLDFQINLKPLSDDKSWELELAADSPFITYTVQLGDGSDPVILNATGQSTSLTLPDFMSYGNYVIEVTSRIAGLNGSVTKVANAFYTYPADTALDVLECPEIIEPDTEYKCNVSVTALPVDVITAKFSSPKLEYAFSGIVTEYYHVGDPPPRDPDEDSGVAGVTKDEFIYKYRHPIDEVSKSLFFDLYLYESGSVSYGFLRSCLDDRIIPRTLTLRNYKGLDSSPFPRVYEEILKDRISSVQQEKEEAFRRLSKGLVYCHYLGGCVASCPYDDEHLSYTCPSKKLLFCAHRGTCETQFTSDICSTYTEKANYVKETKGESLEKGFHRLSYEYDLTPGTVPIVKGPIARRNISSPEGDTISDLETDSHHLFSVVLAKSNPYTLDHNCVAPGVINLSFDVISSTRTIYCQWKITDVALRISQAETDAYNPTINDEPSYYGRSDLPFTYTVILSVSGPVTLTFIHTHTSTGYTFNETFTNEDNLPKGSSPHELEFSVSVTTTGCYNVTVMAENRHNLHKQPIQNWTTLCIQHPVVNSLAMSHKPTEHDAFLIPGQEALFALEDNSGAAFPDNATFEISWGDGKTTKLFSLGIGQQEFSHQYLKGGLYTVTARVHNDVSESATSCQVTIIEAIKDFAVTPMYFPTLDSPSARAGYGQTKHLFPLDKNTSFFPSMSQGSVKTYTLKHTESGALILTLETTSQFKPLAHHLSTLFNEERVFNVTITAANVFEEVSFDVSVEILGMIRGLGIDDYAIVTQKEEEKRFNVSFQTMGSRSCMLVSWGDDSYLSTFGNEAVCQQQYSWAVHESNSLSVSNEITHTYMKNGIYNMSVAVSNPISSVNDVFMFLVTDINCTPPKVEIIDAVLFYLDAPRLLRSQPVNIFTKAALKCNVTSMTKKSWQIYRLDESLGELRTPVADVNKIPSASMSQLTIPSHFLDYGFYQVFYTLTMWDPANLDPYWPFLKTVTTMINIVRTDLLPIIMENGVSRVIRGRKQEVALEPGIYSVDPDFPDSKDFTFKWKCRRRDEQWPGPDMDSPQPIFPKGPSSGGCFGYGPGLLDLPKGTLYLLGSDFVDDADSFEFEVTIEKDVRQEKSIAQVVLKEEDVPILRAKCLAKEFCRAFPDGFYINPSYQLDMTMECISACDPPLKYEWVAYDSHDKPLPVKSGYFPLGATDQEVGVSVAFHKDFIRDDMIILSGTATNSLNKIGASSFFLWYNREPSGGTCELIHPPTNKALISKYVLQCKGWTDREDLDIMYKISLVEESTGKETTMATLNHADKEIQSIELLFPPGTFKVLVTVIDEWQAFTVVTVEEKLQIAMMTQDEFGGETTMGPLRVTSGAGDVPTLNMNLAALTAIMNKADWMATENKSKAEVTDILLTMDQYNNFGIRALLENTNFNNLQTIEMTSSTVANLYRAASKNLEIIKSISIETREATLDMMETIIDGVENSGVIVPDQLQMIGDNLASIASNNMLGIFEIGSDEECKNAPPSDLRDSDKLPFDTDIGTDIHMKIPPSDTEIRMCNVRDVTKERGYDQVPKLENAVNRLTKTALKRCLVGESWTFSDPNSMMVDIGMTKLVGEKWTVPLADNKSFIILPEGFCPTGTCGDPVGISIVNWPYLTHSYTPGAKSLALGTRVLDVEISQRNGTTLIVDRVDPPILVDVPRTLNKMGVNDFPEPLYVNATDVSSASFVPVVYSTFNVSKNFSSVNIELTPEHDNHRLFLMVSPLRVPTLTKHHWYTMVKDIPVKRNGTYDYFIPSTEINVTGFFYVGVGEFTPDFDISLMKNPVENQVNLTALQNVSLSYSIRSLTSGCYFFDRKARDWDGRGVKVVNSDHSATRCASSHLTSFAVGLFIPPNAIDFSFVFANIGFVDNLTIYLTLIISLSIFFLLMIWARVMDHRDLKKLGASPLPDNHVQDKYLYEILVFTGNRKGAQTDSTVQFILTGDRGETDVRTFGDSKRQILRKAGVDVFVMAVPRPLGQLEFLRIWHDNSGKGPNASWYLNYIVFRDVQTGLKYEFIANQWFALEKDDGLIERILPAAGDEEKRQFQHLFNTTTDKNIADGHLWFSVFLRPARSRFTRCQRVGSCFALLFLSMLVNAMWYDKVPEQPSTGGLKFGPFSLTPAEIGVGVISNLIVFPPSFLIVFLFRRARPSKLRESRIQKAVEKTREEFRSKHSGSSADEDSDTENQKTEKSEISYDHEKQRDAPSSDEDQNKEEKEKTKKKKKKKLTLPPFFRYVAWLLVFACIGVSCFFLLMYGVMFGNSKATKWVLSLIVSFFSSVLFVQPLKIFLMAFLVSAIFKSGDQDEDDADEDEENPKLQPNEEWMHDDTARIARRYGAENKDLLEKLRHQRRQEVGMNEIMKEIFLYALFIWILLILSHGNRDPNAFWLQKELHNAFVNDAYENDDGFAAVKTTDKLWYYLHNNLFQSLRADTLYNGKPPYGLRGFLEDHYNRIMGYATIRQIRAKRTPCSVASTMRDIVDHCSDFSQKGKEDHEDYCIKWIKPTPETINTPQCQTREFQYSTAKKLQGFPKWGKLDWYSGGGYVVHLQGPSADLRERFLELQKDMWIDNYTRAVLIEFSTYNAGVNLFGTGLLMAEYTPGGGIMPTHRFEGIRLLNHHSNFGAFVIVCEVVFILFIIFYTVREIRAMYTLGRAYFKNYWSFAEIAIIVASYAMMVIYGLRYKATRDVLEVFKNTFGNGYVNLTYAAILNEFYLYLVSFIGFVGSLKFIKLLRFNKKIGVLSVTLRQCWDDLAGFLVAFFLCFFSFVNMFYFLLSMYIEEFCNFVVAVETCFSMMLGKFNFDQMREVSILVPLMFFVFVVLNSWVLINLLLTVIIQAFIEIKHDMLKQPNEYEIVDFVWGRFKTFIGLQGRQRTQLKNGRMVDANNKEPSQGSTEEKLEDLPEKVDKFLEYINAIYFDGNLDHRNKSSLASAYSTKPLCSSGPPKGAGTNDSAGTWPQTKSQFSARHPSDTNDHGSGGRWAGAEDDIDYGSRLMGRKATKKKADSEGEMSYTGPRVSNRFQAELDDF
ncbi:uncharacterized protein LOC135206294 [Macrobrachium nipponense]|uniref:uncharacterized protein LOC135206294 n=1 Tax=Macrobrachium nipponense TaxID=159736 RepID=UPI0030C815A3